MEEGYSVTVSVSSGSRMRRTNLVCSQDVIVIAGIVRNLIAVGDDVGTFGGQDEYSSAFAVAGSVKSRSGKTADAGIVVALVFGDTVV